MILGILSDTHGDVKRTAKAVTAIKAYAPDRVIHCGDIGSSAVLTELATGFMDPIVPVTCVLGNVDAWDQDIASPLPHVVVAGRFFEIELDGKRIAVIHGDDYPRLIAAIESGAYDYVFTGHTHQRADERQTPTRIINPGAIHRSREPSCAVLDLSTGALTWIPIT